MIQTQIIKEGNKSIAVILDYAEYMRLKDLEVDREDYQSAITAERETTSWHSHDDVMKELGIN